MYPSECNEENHHYQIGRAVQQECRDRKSGSAGMPRPISYAVFCLKKKRIGVLITLMKSLTLIPSFNMITTDRITCVLSGKRFKSNATKAGIMSTERQV